MATLPANVNVVASAPDPESSRIISDIEADSAAAAFALNNAQLERIKVIIGDVIERRSRGENFSDMEVVAAHPQLMPRLQEELAALQEVHRSILLASAAGSWEAPSPLDASRLDEPIHDDTGQTADLMGMVAIRGYRLLQELSSGGQATVFRAIREITGRVVAVKVIHGGPFVGTRGRARFERESAMLASLSHPNIVGILDQGRTADGSFFLVTDFVEGCSLDVYLKRNELDLPAVLRLFVTIAQAVDEIHRNGIVHRDLKPKNIIVDNRGEPHVLDFGLARPLKDDLAQASQEHLTLTGQVVGSLPWSSPEQVGGNAMRVDQRTDVYALGIMLYEATTCSFPYPIDGGLPGLAQHILHSPPITPHFVIKCDSPPTIQLFESVLMKSLAKSPADRHQSAGILARDLESCLTAQYSARRVQLSGKSLLRATCVAAIAGTMLSTKGSTPVSFSASVGPTASARRIPFIEPTVFSLPSFTNSLGMRLVRIPAGNGRVGDLRSQHGSSDSERPRIIRINAPFFIAVTVVTQQQYSKLFHTDPSYPNFKGPNFPVNGVSWDQTLDFCRSLSFEERRHYRLPTEIEWEYACRAGGPGEFGGYARPDDMGWYRENSGVCLHSVALKAPNPWGLYDMNGNVWQWCSFDHTDLVSSRTSVSDENRIAKGGSFQDASFNCRSASRCLFSHQLKDRTIGFRVVCDLD